MRSQSNMPRKGTRRALGAAITAGVLIVVLLFNILFSLVADRFMWQLDETVNRYTSRAGISMYTPTDEFLDVVRERALPLIDKINADREAKGEEPIKLNIIFCADRDRVYETERLRMIQYTALALQKEFPDAFEVSYVNVEKNPSAVQKYKATSATSIYAHQVIFEFGGEFRVCSYDYFFLASDESSREYWSYNGEQEIASLVLALTRAEAPVAAFIKNHGERVADCQALRRLMERSGYDVVEIDLSADPIPENCRLLVSYDPQTDFLGLGNAAFAGDADAESEIDKLDAFLDQAYSLMLFVDKDTPELPVLEEYLEEWGIELLRGEDAEGVRDSYTLCDPVQKLDKDGYTLIADYVTGGSGASVTKDMRSVPYPAKVVFPNATAIRLSDVYRRHVVDADAAEGTAAYEYGQYHRNGVSRYLYDVLWSSTSATAEVLGERYEVATEQNRFKLMTLSVEARSVQETNYLSTQRPSYLALFTSTDFASDEVLGSAAYGNADVLTSTLRYVGREVVPADLEFKAFKVYDVDPAAYIPDAGAMVATTVILTALPLIACAAAGVYVLVRRKQR